MFSSNKIFYLAVLPAMFMQFVASFFYFVIIEPGTTAAAIYGGLKFIMILWPIFGFFYFFKKDLPRFGASPNRGQSLLYGLIAGLAIFAAMLVLAKLMNNYFLPGIPVLREKWNALAVFGSFIFFSVSLCTVNAAFEEYYWRWFVFRGLVLKMSWPMAMVVSSAAFASHHLVLASQFFTPGISVIMALEVFVGGLVFSWLYYKTGSLLGSFIAHFSADVAMMFVLYNLLFK